MFYWKWGWSTKNPTANCRFISMTPTLEESLQQLFPIYSSHFTIWKIHHECKCISYWMVGIFQLILLVLKGIQFPKKTRRTSGRTKKKKNKICSCVLDNTCGSKQKTSRSWVLDGEKRRWPNACQWDPRQLCNFLVFDGQNFEMQNIATLHIAWGARPPRMPHLHAPFSSCKQITRKLAQNITFCGTKPIPSMYIYIYMFMVNIPVVVWESYPLASKNIPP